jgi:hypothetical protein
MPGRRSKARSAWSTSQGRHASSGALKNSGAAHPPIPVPTLASTVHCPRLMPR